MTRTRKGAKLAKVALALSAAALLLAACQSSGNAPGSSSTTSPGDHLTKLAGGTLTIAEGAAAGPNYIFPMMAGAYFSVANFELIYLMFRPLYWFGVGSTAGLNEMLSLAFEPAYSNGGKTVTIRMKGYKWSNGQTVSARDVLFWMNLLKADATSWAAYAPGRSQFPGDVTNVVADDSTDTVTFTLDAAYSQLVFTDNELSQITPLPTAWDVNAPGAPVASGGCSKATYASLTTTIKTVKGKPTTVATSKSAKACAAVYAFLTGKTEAGDPATFATNPLWQVVDGPFHLTAYDATTNGAALVPNKVYSGPLKPSIDKLVLAPFTSDTAELGALSGGGKIDIGYVPARDVPVYKGKVFGPNGPLVGANDAHLAASYNLAPWYAWGINYFAMNYTSPKSGPIFSQLYVRQALQSLVNQSLWIQQFDSGYGAPTYGPVPFLPPTADAGSQESDNPYPYSPSRAVALLSSHGWDVVPNGTTRCASPGTGAGECGRGIEKGAAMSFRYVYYDGATAFVSQIKALAQSWAQAGIELTLAAEPFSDVISAAATRCTRAKACGWDLANWSGGWAFAPDYYPTGEDIFATGTASNFGSYSDARNDANIKLTLTSSSPQSLYAYENYLAKEVPVIWQPEAPYQLTEVGKDVCGVEPQNILLNWVPEAWYFCKEG